MWSDVDIIATTGYTIELLREPLYLLSDCLNTHLPNSKFSDFDIEGIKTFKN